MKKELVAATRNREKLSEIRRLLRGSGIRVLSLDNLKNLPRVKEDGKTFRANAVKKAIETSSRIDKLVMADDSGLEVPALGNNPGVNSARYAGPSQDDDKNNAKLLKEMRHFTGRRRRARFRCVVCLSKGKKVLGIIDGKVEGRIGFMRDGSFGFGYDSLFIPEGFEKPFGRLGAGIKDRISHRAIALEGAKKVIQRHFQRYP